MNINQIAAQNLLAKFGLTVVLINSTEGNAAESMRRISN